jgi:hypothetical protein
MLKFGFSDHSFRCRTDEIILKTANTKGREDPTIVIFNSFYDHFLIYSKQELV